MSFDPQSPSDRADMEPDEPTVCEWCDEQIDQSDVDVEAFETFGGMICRECAEAWAGSSSEQQPIRRTIPTTCIEHAYGSTYRLSFQIKVF